VSVTDAERSAVCEVFEYTTGPACAATIDADAASWKNKRIIILSVP
jgi:hypothetical protein